MEESDIVVLRERIAEGIDDSSLVEVVKLLIPSSNPNLFALILQQNAELGRKAKQERSLELFLDEDRALQGCKLSV
jgi:hypothetical protein